MQEIDERLIAIEEWRSTELSQQLLDLEEWKGKQIKLARKFIRWLALGLVLFALGIGAALYQIDNLVEANRAALISQNQFDRRLVMEQFHLNVVRWQTCRDRNEIQRQTLRQDTEQLRGLIKAHTRDGDKATTKFWQSYLKKGQETKLPECGPKPPPPADLPANVPKEP